MYGTRGTRDGTFDGNEYDLSPTLLLHGSKRKWVGNVVFNDNHAEQIENFFPPLTVYEPLNGVEAEKDNIFAAEFDDYPDNATGTPPGQASGDAYQVMATASMEFENTVVYDQLVD